MPVPIIPPGRRIPPLIPPHLPPAEINIPLEQLLTAKRPYVEAGNPLGNPNDYLTVNGDLYVKSSILTDGNINVKGDIVPTNADCAEEFDLSSNDITEPGTVMVLNEAGNLEQSNQAYDKKVAGIVSGAGNYKPAIVLDKSSKTDNKRIPIALMGKVYCKVDATHSPIEIGDLLTTSQTKGHAMKAEDPLKAFGAVIGKALGSIKEGFGMIPVLVALQ